MTTARLTWEFPEEQTGTKTHGFTTAGIAHFSANRDAALFRECLQNSLDADDAEKGVTVDIDMKELPANLLGAQSLAEALHRSCESRYNSEDGRSQFGEAAKLLQQETIPALSITDVETLGAPEEVDDENEVSPWEAMTNSEGHSVKLDGSSLGSFGLGKHAPFAATPLRTVLYSTCYQSKSDGNGGGYLQSDLSVVQYS